MSDLTWPQPYSEPLQQLTSAELDLKFQTYAQQIVPHNVDNFRGLIHHATSKLNEYVRGHSKVPAQEPLNCLIVLRVLAKLLLETLSNEQIVETFDGPVPEPAQLISMAAPSGNVLTWSIRLRDCDVFTLQLDSATEERHIEPLIRSLCNLHPQTRFLLRDQLGRWVPSWSLLRPPSDGFATTLWLHWSPAMMERRSAVLIQSVVDFLIDIPPTEVNYELHVECLNLLLVLLSSQLYHPLSDFPFSLSSTAPFLDIVMDRPSVAVRAVPLVRALIGHFIRQQPVPTPADSKLGLSKLFGSVKSAVGTVGSAATNVWSWRPSNPFGKAVTPSSSSNNLKPLMSRHEFPLASKSLMLLMLLIHNRSDKKSPLMYNPYREAIRSFHDENFDPEDPERTAVSTFSARLPFGKVYDALSSHLQDECATVLLYSLIHYNSLFLSYVLSKSDLDTLMLPLLEILYNAPNPDVKMKSNQIYMLLIVILLLSQDVSFTVNVNRQMILSTVPWFHERVLNQISLGSLIVVVLIRTIRFNLAKLRDSYLHTNCFAALANLAPHSESMHMYAAMRLVSLFDVLSRKYLKLHERVQATQTQTQTPSTMQTQTGASRVAWRSSNDIASLQSVLEQCLSTLGALAPLPLVIDSLSDLSAAHSMDALCDFFFSLRTRLPGIGPIFALIHEDVHTPAEIKTLQYCCNGFIGLNAQSTAYECITKRKSGKITREPVPSSLAPLPVRMPSGPTSTPVATAKPVSNTPPIPTAGPTPVDPTQDLTFNLRLTDEQRRAKNSMVLPYEHQDVNKEWGAFQIENEEEDDEQDPDDDLDV
eukprot:GILJ01007696.1.p1 GENE.GILJ01007696.1~~GILJ01007696.1.p1  ORF type:complete len:816 (+),score=103.05 GILJ01007696.1:46-2493(+)